MGYRRAPRGAAGEPPGRESWPGWGGGRRTRAAPARARTMGLVAPGGSPARRSTRWNPRQKLTPPPPPRGSAPSRPGRLWTCHPSRVQAGAALPSRVFSQSQEKRPSSPRGPQGEREVLLPTPPRPAVTRPFTCDFSLLPGELGGVGRTETRRVFQSPARKPQGNRGFPPTHARNAAAGTVRACVCVCLCVRARGGRTTTRLFRGSRARRPRLKECGVPHARELPGMRSSAPTPAINFCFDPLHINHNRKASPGPPRNTRGTSQAGTPK